MYNILLESFILHIRRGVDWHLELDPTFLMGDYYSPYNSASNFRTILQLYKEDMDKLLMCHNYIPAPSPTHLKIYEYLHNDDSKLDNIMFVPLKDRNHLNYVDSFKLQDWSIEHNQ